MGGILLGVHECQGMNRCFCLSLGNFYDSSRSGEVVQVLRMEDEHILARGRAWRDTGTEGYLNSSLPSLFESISASQHLSISDSQTLSIFNTSQQSQAYYSKTKQPSKWFKSPPLLPSLRWDPLSWPVLWWRSALLPCLPKSLLPLIRVWLYGK